MLKNNLFVNGKTSLVSSLAITLMMTHVPAAAQDTVDTPEVRGDVEGDGVGDIVVTARKRSETLQDVPLSVAAFDRALVERYDISDLEDVAKRTPNLSYSNNLGLGGGVPVIRGIGAPRSGARASVGIFIDGVDTGNANGVSVQSFDIERIEVVRGPQSTQFGRGVLAGAINYISRRPNWDALEGEVGGEIAQYGLYRVEGRVSGPITDGLAVSLAAQRREFDGFYNNTLTGKDTGDSKSTAVVAGVRARIATDGEAYLRLSYNKDQIGQPAWHQVATNTQTGPSASQRWYVGVLEGDPSQIAHNADDYAGVNKENYRATLHLNYDFGNVNVASISSYGKDDTFADNDSDFTAHPPLVAGTTLLGTFRSFTTSNSDDFSQELRLQSSGNGPLQWLIGGYFRTEDFNSGEYLLVPQITGPEEFQAPNTLSRKLKTYGAFGSVSVELMEGLTFSQELRYSEDRVEETSYRSDSGHSASFASKFTNWLPRSILEYQMSRDHMVYWSISKGNKPGGFNNTAGAGFSDVPDELKPFGEEELWNYEFGFKTRWFDDKLTFNTSAFYVDWSDIQVSSQVMVNGLPVGLTVNGGKADGFGFESEFRFRPNRTIDLYGGFGYSPIRLIDYVDRRVVSAGLPLEHRAQAAGSPDWTGNVGALLTIPVTEDGNAFLQGDVNYRSTTYATEANLAETGDKTTVDLQAGFRNNALRAAIYVNNLFDDKAISSARAFVNPTNYARSFIAQLPARRQIGARVTFRF